jgi:hypothetical protein
MENGLVQSSLRLSLRSKASIGKIRRRQFLQDSLFAAGAFTMASGTVFGADSSAGSLTNLPEGSAPKPLTFPHFPDRLHAFIWRNWQLVPVDRMASVLGTTPSNVRNLGEGMGLGHPPRISSNQWRRSAQTILRRNWHILPYSQLLQLLGWSAEQLAFSLREDDFLFEKLGNLKPHCEILRFTPPDAEVLNWQKRVRSLINEKFPRGVHQASDPLFGFIGKLSKVPARPAMPASTVFSPRYCYSYFALYGDSLLGPPEDLYPEGYLAQLSAAGANGVWLQGLLTRLAPFPWAPRESDRYEERLANLRALVERAQRHGMGVYLYLNEPRSMPLAFFANRPHLKGVVEGGYASMCTSQPEVQQHLVEAVTLLCRSVPGLAGLFTITGSENLTHCWSHHHGEGCPRCSKRSPSDVVAELNSLFYQGIQKAGTQTRLIAWDWGWADEWVNDIIARLPPKVSFMSVSEWGIPINRGGVASTVGEYSISTVGPGARAKSRWTIAHDRGLKTLAKIQAGNTWELSAVPYIPAVANVAHHAANLLQAKVDGLMLGWTLGGYPSPNLEVVAEVARLATVDTRIANADPDKLNEVVESALRSVAERRFGHAVAPTVVNAWKTMSAAFSEFPFGGGLYSEPVQFGPSNLLWSEPTHFAATMMGFPYDDLKSWRGAYPVDVYCHQLETIAKGFEVAIDDLKRVARRELLDQRTHERELLAEEIQVAEAAAIHFQSTANQARFVAARDALSGVSDSQAALPWIQQLSNLVTSELNLAMRLHAIQMRDSRIGFEASNQYYYVPVDLAEKVLNCRDLLDRWIPELRRKWPV